MRIQSRSCHRLLTQTLLIRWILVLLVRNRARYSRRRLASLKIHRLPMRIQSKRCHRLLSQVLVRMWSVVALQLVALLC